MTHDMEEVDEFGLSEADYKLLRDEEDFVRGFDYSCLSGDTLNQNQLALGYGFTAGYQAALPQWVPIADIPYEWRDGRRLLATRVASPSDVFHDVFWGRRSVHATKCWIGWPIMEALPSHLIPRPSPPKDNES